MASLVIIRVNANEAHAILLELRHRWFQAKTKDVARSKTRNIRTEYKLRGDRVFTGSYAMLVVELL